MSLNFKDMKLTTKSLNEIWKEHKEGHTDRQIGQPMHLLMNDDKKGYYNYYESFGKEKVLIMYLQWTNDLEKETLTYDEIVTSFKRSFCRWVPVSLKVDNDIQALFDDFVERKGK